MPWYTYVYKAIEVGVVVLSGYEISQIFNDEDDEGKAALELATQLGKELVKRNEDVLRQTETMHEIQIAICGMAVLLLGVISVGSIALICQILKRCAMKAIKDSIEESIEA